MSVLAMQQTTYEKIEVFWQMVQILEIFHSFFAPSSLWGLF